MVSGVPPPVPSWRWSGPRCCGWSGFSCLRALAVAREHTFGRFQFAELAGEFLALCIDASERLADPLLLFGDLVQYRHSLPSRQSKG